MSQQYTGARIDDELKEEVRMYAARNGMSQSDFFRQAVAEKLQRAGTEGKQIEEVYTDRNLLACAFTISTIDNSGWKIDEDNADWSIVWVELPSGQVSWHVPTELAEQYVTNYERVKYDGYDRNQKNDRLKEWMEL